MAGSASLVSFIDLFNQAFPNIGWQQFWGLPLFRVFLFSLPVDNTGKKGDSVRCGGAVSFRLIGPLHRAAHGGGLEFAAGDRFAGETFGFFDAFLFRLRCPVVPRLSKGGVFAGEVNGGNVIGRERLGNGVFPLRNVNMNHSRGFVVTENKSDDLLAAADIQGDVAPLIEGSLEGMSTRCGVGTGEGRAFD